ncbi:hypothetical protein GCM10009554_30220 [Kribbella koreensis]|uniref:Amidohydrolase-related domain-containing protein n=1 Tax=Kribbella koreensis TaxID=57909 RepID=A0ABN1QBP4_9ACTN
MADWLIRSPEEHIQYDVDVLFGPWPSHPTDMDLAGLKAHLSHHHIQNALTLSTRGALFSDQAGNAETLAATRQPPNPSPSATSPSGEGRPGGAAGQGGWMGEDAGRRGGSEVGLVPVGTVDLRDAVGAAEQLDGLVGSGVRFLRLFTGAQGVQGETPAYRHVVGEAVARGMVILQDGDPRKFGAVLAGRGADVVFLDLHVYLLGDFVLMAKQEPGFRATTRMLSSPDGIERVVDGVGARHLVFGSRTPFMDVSPQTLRLRYARIGAEDRALIAGGNIQGLMG